MKKYLLTFLTVWIIGICIGLVGASIGSLKTSETGKPLKYRPRSETDQIKWYGGKPRPPIEVSIAPISPVTPDSETEVLISVTPMTSCSSIKVQIRGTHGIVALNPNHGLMSPCEQNTPAQFTARIRVPAEASGALVADVTLEGEEGHFSFSQSAPVAASDAKAPFTLSMGNLKVGAQGDVVREMKADEKIN